MSNLNTRIIEAHTQIWATSQNLSQASWLMGQALAREGEGWKVAEMKETLQEIEKIEKRLNESRDIITKAIASFENKDAA